MRQLLVLPLPGSALFTAAALYRHLPWLLLMSQAHPIHLWDACTGGIRCTYRAYDDADEVTAAYSLSFSPDGGQLLAGFSKCIRIFDVTRPGRDCTKVVTQKRGQQGSIPGAGGDERVSTDARSTAMYHTLALCQQHRLVRCLSSAGMLMSHCNKRPWQHGHLLTMRVSLTAWQL